jgi:biopolymer transport protein ExbD
MQSRLRSPGKLVAEINTVPFTDVVLVLLVIFMVTTPFMFQGSFQIKLPKVAAPSPNLPETITITVAPGDKVMLNDKEVTLDELTSQLKTMVQQKPSAIVMINADKSVTHGSVTQVMSRAYVAGVTKVGIAVEIDSQSSATVPVKLETAK